MRELSAEIATLPQSDNSTARKPHGRLGQFGGALAVPLGTFLATRLMLAFVNFAARILVPENALPDLPHVLPADFFWDGWLRWDSIDYLSIVQTGYWFDPATGQHSPLVLPLYPALARLVSPLVGNLPLAFLLVSNLAFLFAAIVIYFLSLRRWGTDKATLSVVLVATLPYSFVYSAAYPHSLGLLLVALPFLVLASEHRGWAVLPAALAPLAHPVGLALLPALLIDLLKRWGRRRWYARVDSVGSMILFALPSAGFALYLSGWVGLPASDVTLTFLGGADGLLPAPLDSLIRAFSGPANGNFLAWLNVGLLGLCLSLIWPTARQLGWSSASYCLGVVFLAALWPTRAGETAALAFPVYIVLALALKEELAGVLAVSTSALFAGLLTAAFAGWYWVDGSVGPPPAQVKAERVASFYASQGWVPAERLNMVIGGDVLVTGFDLQGQRFQPGGTLSLDFGLHALRSSSKGYLLSVGLFDSSGRRWTFADRPLFTSGQPPRLVEGADWRENIRLSIDSQIPSGIYSLKLNVLEVEFMTGSYYQPVVTSLEGNGLPRTNLREITVVREGDLTPADAVAIPHQLSAKLGENIRMYGYDLGHRQPDGTVSVALYWGADGRVDRDYTVFVQMLDSSGHVAGQSDSFPLAGRYPTSRLGAGEVLRDVHVLKLQDQAIKGPLRVIAGMYSLADMRRLPVVSNGGTADHIVLGELPE